MELFHLSETLNVHIIFARILSGPCHSAVACAFHWKACRKSSGNTPST
jgi:hypothetical protein